MSRRKHPPPTPTLPSLPEATSAPELDAEPTEATEAPHEPAKATSAPELDAEPTEATEAPHELPQRAPELDAAERADLANQAPAELTPPSSPRRAHPALTVVLTWDAAADLAAFFEHGGDEYAPSSLDRFAEMLRLAVQEQATCPNPTLFVTGAETPTERAARLAPIPMPPPSDPPVWCPRRAPDCPAFEENGARYCPRCVCKV